MKGWQTWSGTARCAPAELVRPTTETQLALSVQRAAEQGQTVRVAGAGHSFNHLACTGGVLLDMTSYTGVLGLDRDAGTVTVRAGTTLWEVSRALDRRGLALANIGTLAEQTVAGAVSTGNHGTGLAHGPLSTQVIGLRMVTADGVARNLEPGSELFRGARTALGALGVISTVTLRCVPQFRLRVSRRTEVLAGLLERFPEWAASADHVAFGWLPWQDVVSVRTLDRTEDRVTRGAWRERPAATLAEVHCGLVGTSARVHPRLVPALTGRGGGGVSGYVDHSHRVFTFRQPVRFIAMEHALPLGRVPAALEQLRGALRRIGVYSPYGVLVRVGAGDDTPLSPAYGRPTGYVNLTVPRTPAYLEVLRAAEHVLREHDGRPHWGKAHTATAEVLAPRYPRWEAFARLRAEVDPAGTFHNDYLARVLGATGPTTAPVRALAGVRG